MAVFIHDKMLASLVRIHEPFQYLVTAFHTIDLRDLTTSVDTNTDINHFKSFLAKKVNRLIDLGPKDLRLNKLKGRTVDLDETCAALAVSNSRSSLLLN